MKRLVSLVAALSIFAVGCGSGADGASTLTVEATATPAPATATPEPSPAPTAVPTIVSVTWDGTTCDYRGPAVFPRSAHVLWNWANLGEALSDEGVGAALIVGGVKAGTTWEQVLENDKNVPASKQPPANADLSDPYTMINTPTGSWNMLMTGDEYWVGCATAPESTDKTFSAALVYVIDR
jgi:hypothetical protein